MAEISRAASAKKRPRYLPLLVVGLTLGVFGAAIAVVSLNLRHQIRDQIARREAELLLAVFRTQQRAEETEEDFDGLTEDPADQFFLVLKATQIEEDVRVLQGEVFGTRLFNSDGQLVTAIPASLTEAGLAQADLAELTSLRPVSQFRPGARWSDVFLQMPPENGAAEPTLSLFEITIPLYRQNEGRLLGAAQFVLDGRTIARHYASVDQHLCLQAAGAFLSGSLLIVAALAWAFRRLQRANRLLAERTTNLIRANHELALSARTSAVGAVVSHLIHGLKNPLFGLRSLAEGRRSDAASVAEDDWRVAAEATQRMQAMIDEVVRVLREESGAAGYEISLAELVELVEAKARPAAAARAVIFETALAAEGTLNNRTANLVALILANLIQNALEASPPGKTVRLSVRADGSDVLCEVADQGPGLSPHAQGVLFTPGPSSKEGGTGIGLAISKQLANHLGAALDLKTSTPSGTVFALRLPANLLAETASAPTEAVSA